MTARWRTLAHSCVVIASSLVAACATPLPVSGARGVRDEAPAPAMRARGYEGPALPEQEVATVFMLDGRPDFESGYLCKVDGKPVHAGGCVSIVYLTPGRHVLSIRYRSRLEVGEGEIAIQVQAGKLYQLNASSLRTNHRGLISLLPMASGAKLTYRNVAPWKFQGTKLDEPVPYGDIP